MPLSYCWRSSNLAEFRITATFQQHDQQLGPEHLQVNSIATLRTLFQESPPLPVVRLSPVGIRLLSLANLLIDKGEHIVILVLVWLQLDGPS